MNSAERVKYFYEMIISENQVERVAEFVSPKQQSRHIPIIE